MQEIRGVLALSRSLKNGLSQAANENLDALSLATKVLASESANLALPPHRLEELFAQIVEQSFRSSSGKLHNAMASYTKSLLDNGESESESKPAHSVTKIS
jgi:hypothetical protein